MLLNFATRREAREHCKKWNIKSKHIVKLAGSHPWRVSCPELSTFEIGKKYMLVDVDGFASGRLSNKIQAQQIKAHLPNGVKITKKSKGLYSQDTIFEFDNEGAPVSFCTLNKNEARFFYEVKEEKGPSIKKAKTKPVYKKEVSVSDVAVDPTLDSMLDSEPTEEETWLFDRQYVLVDRDGFINNNSTNVVYNEKIADAISDKPFIVHSDGGRFVSISNLHYRLSSSKLRLNHDERKYFKEYKEPVVEVKSLAEIKIDKARENLKIAADNHDKAITALRNAGELLRIAANELTKLVK